MLRRSSRPHPLHAGISLTGAADLNQKCEASTVVGVLDTLRMSEGEVRPSGRSLGAPAAQELKPHRMRPRSRWVLLTALAVVLAVVGGYGLTHALEEQSRDRGPTLTPEAPVDSDADGLSDEIEKSGWMTWDGQVYRTDPAKADTDDDGLWDGDEAGATVTGAPSPTVYAGFSSPLLADTDGDGLGDADEADLGLNPLDRDSDDDQIEDGPEVELVGADPETADTDGDGFRDGYEDVNREAQGLDPLSVDIKVSKWTYAGDYAKGALAGDLWREDSLAWLAGNLTSGAASSVPVIGSFVGPVADMRDTVGSAIHADWVGSGFSAVGAVPGGDAVAIPGKAARFVGRNPELIAATAAIIAGSTKIPDALKIRAAKRIWKDDWQDLVSAGTSQKALLTLQRGRKPLDGLADAIKRPGHINGAPAQFFATGNEGEAFLGGLFGAKAKGVNLQVRASTADCGEICSNSRVRIFDVFVGGVAHESKVGFVGPSQFTERQIRKDAWLVNNGYIKGAHWHFFASSRSNTLGADTRVLDMLDTYGIPYTIHAPR